MGEDLESLLNLLKTCYDGWHNSPYWVWKYQNNPDGSPIIWVAEDKGRIVGCYILNPVSLRIGQVKVKAAQSVDAAVHPNYRGAGLFKKLASNAINQASRDGIAIIYAFPTEIAFKGQLRIGYSPVFAIPKMFTVFRARSLVEKTETENPLLQSARVAAILLPNFPLKKTNVDLNKNLELRKVERFDSRFEAFWKKACNENVNIMVEKNAAYLTWRYFEHPEIEYTSYVCQNRGEIVGFIVLSVERDASLAEGKTGTITIGNIVDLLSLQSDMNNAIPALVSIACKHFINEHVDIARCWMPKGHPYRSILQKFGFYEHYELLRRAIFRPKYDSQLICYLNSRSCITGALESLPKMTKPCWFVMQGDTDYM